jgi:hypothetical protein
MLPAAERMAGSVSVSLGRGRAAAQLCWQDLSSADERVFPTSTKRIARPARS